MSGRLGGAGAFAGGGTVFRSLGRAPGAAAAAAGGRDASMSRNDAIVSYALPSSSILPWPPSSSAHAPGSAGAAAARQPREEEIVDLTAVTDSDDEVSGPSSSSAGAAGGRGGGSAGRGRGGGSAGGGRSGGSASGGHGGGSSASVGIHFTTLDDDDDDDDEDYNDDYEDDDDDDDDDEQEDDDYGWRNGGPNGRTMQTEGSRMLGWGALLSLMGPGLLMQPRALSDLFSLLTRSVPVAPSGPPPAAKKSVRALKTTRVTAIMRARQEG